MARPQRPGAPTPLLVAQRPAQVAQRPAQAAPQSGAAGGGAIGAMAAGAGSAGTASGAAGCGPGGWPSDWGPGGGPSGCGPGGGPSGWGSGSNPNGATGSGAAGTASGAAGSGPGDIPSGATYCGPSGTPCRDPGSGTSGTAAETVAGGEAAATAGGAMVSSRAGGAGGGAASGWASATGAADVGARTGWGLAEVKGARSATGSPACADVFSTLSAELAVSDSAAPKTATAAAEMVNFLACETSQGLSLRGSSLRGVSAAGECVSMGPTVAIPAAPQRAHRPPRSRAPARWAWRASCRKKALRDGPDVKPRHGLTRVLSFPSPSGWRDQMTAFIGRREFISLLGGAAACPVVAHAQQLSLPVIGYLDSQSPGVFADILLRPFWQGLKDIGYTERENVAIEYRWADNQIDRLPELAAELVRRRVAVIIAGAPPAARGRQGGNHDDPRCLRCRR